MLIRSISRADAAPSADRHARERITAASRRRSCGLSCFESSTPAIARWSGGMITAHATTGPARGPRPTSSTPASNGPNSARRARSIPLHRCGCGLRRGSARSLVPLYGAGGDALALPFRLAGSVSPSPGHRGYSAVPVDGTATFTFFSRIRVALPVRWRR